MRTSSPQKRFRISGDVITLGVLLLLFAYLSFYIMGKSSEGPNPLTTYRRSANIADPGGWMGFYRLLEKRGDHVERWERRPHEWPKDAGAIITGPYQIGGITSVWDSREAEDALDWVKGGGTLIAFTDSNDSLTRALGVSNTGKDTSDKDEEASPSPSPSPSPSASPGDDDDSDEDKKDKYKGPETIDVPLKPGKPQLTLRQPFPFLSGIQQLAPPNPDRFAVVPAGAVIVAEDTRPLVIVVQRGQGTVFVISDAGLVDNAHLSSADNARFAVALAESSLGDSKRQRILFDEYHQNYVQSDSFWEAIGRPGQLAFWQLLVLTLLMAYSYSRRFGLPLPSPIASRVSSEYVSSLADLYRRAHATDAVLEGVYGLFWRDLCRAVSQPQDSDMRTVAALAVRQLATGTVEERQILAQRIENVVQECRDQMSATDTPEEATVPPIPEPAGKKKRVTFREKAERRRELKQRRELQLSETSLLRIAREIDALRKELELGGAVSAAAGGSGV